MIPPENSENEKIAQEAVYGSQSDVTVFRYPELKRRLIDALDTKDRQVVEWTKTAAHALAEAREAEARVVELKKEAEAREYWKKQFEFVQNQLVEETRIIRTAYESQITALVGALENLYVACKNGNRPVIGSEGEALNFAGCLNQAREALAAHKKENPNG